MHAFVVQAPLCLICDTRTSYWIHAYFVLITSLQAQVQWNCFSRYGIVSLSSSHGDMEYVCLVRHSWACQQLWCSVFQWCKWWCTTNDCIIIIINYYYHITFLACADAGMAENYVEIWATTVRQARWNLSCHRSWKTDSVSIFWSYSHSQPQCCVRWVSSKLMHDFSWTFLILIFYSINGKIFHLPIYKKGELYGPLNREVCDSIEHTILLFRMMGIDVADTHVQLTNQPFPDKWIITTVMLFMCFHLLIFIPAGKLSKNYLWRSLFRWALHIHCSIVYTLEFYLCSMCIEFVY